MRRLTITFAVLLCLPLTGCFEEPVVEHFHLTLRGAGPVIVTVVQEVADPDLASSNTALADRMEASRNALEHELDPWSRRFALLQPLAEHQSIERVDGELRRSVHSAVLASFDDVARMVEAEGLSGNLTVNGGVAELSLFSTGGSRATAVQRQKVERRLVEWSQSLADYFESVIDLYGYLDARPDRSVPCFAHIFDTHEGVPGSGPLEPEEEELVLRVKDTMDGVVEALLVADGESYSLNELARLVYDPFPARLTISVTGAVLESEGLVAAPGFFERPAVDAWTALVSLEGRWAAPDLVTALVSPAPEDEQPELDPVEFATRPRSFATPPTPQEVESELLSALVPEPALALRWRPPPPARDDLKPEFEAWLPRIAEAEALVRD